MDGAASLFEVVKEEQDDRTRRYTICHALVVIALTKLARAEEVEEAKVGISTYNLGKCSANHVSCNITAKYSITSLL